MEFIAHRINTVAALEEIPVDCGVEVDLRDQGQELILAHDPFSRGELFSDFLAHYRHGLLILNIKSERIEHRVLDLLKEHEVRDYFFLDSSFPMIYQLTGIGEKKVALRYSEYECLETVMSMAGRADWVWVDCFTRSPLTRSVYLRLKEAGFRLCLVSPELQGRPEDIPPMRDVLREEGIAPDAVCSKIANRQLWA